jgi:hypothetical protein
MIQMTVLAAPIRVRISLPSRPAGAWFPVLILHKQKKCQGDGQEALEGKEQIDL